MTVRAWRPEEEDPRGGAGPAPRSPLSVQTPQTGKQPGILGLETWEAGEAASEEGHVVEDTSRGPAS